MQHNHFYLINTHISPQPKQVGIYPILLYKDGFYHKTWGEKGEWQKAISEVNEAEKSENAIINSSKLLHSNCVKGFADFVSNTLSAIRPAGKTVEDLLNSIPIYVVTNKVKNANDKPYTSEHDIFLEYRIPTHFVCSNISLKDLKKMVKGKKLKSTLSVSAKENNEHKLDGSELDKWKRLPFPVVVGTPLGLYQRDEDIQNPSELKDISKKCRIFLWIDNIQKEAKVYHCDYETLFAQVLCHEFVHALMDVFGGENLQITSAVDDEKATYREYREESLAEGISLFLIRNHCEYARDYLNIWRMVRNNYPQYQLGLAYQYIERFEPAIKEWMEQKMGTTINQDDLYKWMDQACDDLETL